MKRILFLCTGNSCRSQMAEVLMNHLGRGRFEAVSAGAKPAGYVHPLAIKTLQEAKLPTEGLRSKSWEEYRGQSFDGVVTVCDRAKESCPVFPGQPVSLHWGFEDPAEATGTEGNKKKKSFETYFWRFRPASVCFWKLSDFSSSETAGRSARDFLSCVRGNRGYCRQ